jgi:hypothetical protein
LRFRRVVAALAAASASTTSVFSACHAVALAKEGVLLLGFLRRTKVLLTSSLVFSDRERRDFNQSHPDHHENETHLERARYSRMHALLTPGSPLKVKIFLEREAAAKWLGVPLDSLKPK